MIRGLVAAALTLAATLGLATSAQAGQFTVASCQADSANFSTTAFTDFATRGMNIRRACNPEGPGVRGLVTANAIRNADVPRGSVAFAAINAPTGTTFTNLDWAGSVRRSDCRYALQIYAEVPGAAPIPIKNVRANQHCAASGRAQARGYLSRTYAVAGATRIVQRVICMGGAGHTTCSSRQANYVRTYKAVVGVVDNEAPTATITPDTALATGAWVSGVQPLNYSAADNVGVRTASVSGGDSVGGTDQRVCTMATDAGAFATPSPCPNGPGQVLVDTRRFADGTQTIQLLARDAGGNEGASPASTARIDNTPPARVDVGLEGGDGWRNTNDFAATWTNAAENDRAPIVGATYKTCSASASGTCTQTDVAGDGISRIPLQAPGPGEWTVSVWRHDAAGNTDPDAASVPVTLRYDPEPPQLSFNPPDASDPTLITAPVVDKVSGLADGSIEISPAGSGTWQALKTTTDGGRLVARVDDATLPAGSYQVRATAHDQAHNEASTTQRSDGQPMTLALPLRIATALGAGIPRERIERTTVRRHGKRRVTQRRVTRVLHSIALALGQRAQIAGQLTNRDGQGLAGADVQVLESSETTPEHLIGDVTTDPAGRFTYTVSGTTSRTLRFTYAGSAVTLPTQSSVRLVTPAASSLRVNRSKVLNGQSVTFGGHVASVPVPAGGKLVQLEVELAGRWQTFRTVRTDQVGNWSVPYKFARTRGIQWYRFRVELPREAGYPFAAGISKSIRVRVRGRA
jgi:hypothetical protein